MDDKRKLLRHFLAAIVYRTQKAVRGAPADFEFFRAACAIRTPAEIIRHMTGVLGYARTFFIGGQYWPDPLPALQDEVHRLHDIIKDLAHHLKLNTPLQRMMTPERLLQGPLADAMTHAGQLAMLRRLAGAPIPPENFIFADINPEELGSDQRIPLARIRNGRKPRQVGSPRHGDVGLPLRLVQAVQRLICRCSRDC